MNLLLDTHAFLWFCSGDSRVSALAREQIELSSNQSVVSIASLWEIAIKVSLGKLQLHEPYESLIPKLIEENGFTLLDIKMHHVQALIHLPYHHRDPFDRLLISQALTDGYCIVTSDRTIHSYDVDTVW